MFAYYLSDAGSAATPVLIVSLRYVQFGTIWSSSSGGRVGPRGLMRMMRA